MRIIDWIFFCLFMGLSALVFVENRYINSLQEDASVQTMRVDGFEAAVSHRLEIFGERLEVWIDRQKNTEALIFGTVK